MAGGEQRLPGGPERVALKKEIGLVSACAIIIGKGTADSPDTGLCCRCGGGSGPAGAGTGDARLRGQVCGTGRGTARRCSVRLGPRGAGRRGAVTHGPYEVPAGVSPLCPAVPLNAKS